MLEDEVRSLRTAGLAIIALSCTNLAAVIDTKYHLDRGLTPTEIESRALDTAQHSVWGAATYILGNYGRRTMCNKYNSQ